MTRIISSVLPYHKSKVLKILNNSLKVFGFIKYNLKKIHYPIIKESQSIKIYEEAGVKKKRLNIEEVLSIDKLELEKKLQVIQKKYFLNFIDITQIQGHTIVFTPCLENFSAN